MLTGIDGHLLSGVFLEQQVAAGADDTTAERARRSLAAWRARCAPLGPASTARSVLQTAVPLFAALGFEAPAQIDADEACVSATLRSGDRRVALIVIRWGEPPAIGTRQRWRRSVSFWFEEKMSVRRSGAMATCSISKFPGVSSVMPPERDEVE